MFEPAIALAEDGFEVDPQLADSIQYRKDVLSRLPETQAGVHEARRHFLRAGRPLPATGAGRDLASRGRPGRRLHVHGRLGQAVRRRRPPRWRTASPLRDLESYRVIWEEPLETTYRDARIFAPGLSSVGGVDTIEALNLLELAALKTFGPPARSAREPLLAHADHQQPGPLLRPGARRQAIPGRDLSPKSPRHQGAAPGGSGSEMQAGQWPYAIKPAKDRPGSFVGSRGRGPLGQRRRRDSFDLHGLWGNTGIFVGGVSIPDSAAFQQDAIKRAGPGHRLPDAMSPLIVTRDGKPVLASTAIGGGLHQRNIQVLANILEFGMDAQSAVDAPAFLSTGGPRIAPSRRSAKAHSTKTLDEVRALGQEVKELSPEQREMFVGYWIGIEIDPKTGLLREPAPPSCPAMPRGTEAC